MCELPDIEIHNTINIVIGTHIKLTLMTPTDFLKLLHACSKSVLETSTAFYFYAALLQQTYDDVLRTCTSQSYCMCTAYMPKLHAGWYSASTGYMRFSD